MVLSRFSVAASYDHVSCSSQVRLFNAAGSSVNFHALQVVSTAHLMRARRSLSSSKPLWTSWGLILTALDGSLGVASLLNASKTRYPIDTWSSSSEVKAKEFCCKGFTECDAEWSPFRRRQWAGSVPAAVNWSWERSVEGDAPVSGSAASLQWQGLRKRAACLLLTLSLPRVINFKFFTKPNQKYYITQYEERGFS